jgi:peptidoglycan hydrolase CwlO-like protein
MKTKTALIVSGLVTVYVMALVIWVLGGFGWFASKAQASSGAGQAAAAPASTDVATLQQEIATYQQELQQANTQLQAAYNEIATLQSQLESGGNGANGSQSGGFNPFGQ